MLRRGANLDASKVPMTSFAGPYELLERLATGGMAELYLAQRTGSGGFRRLVAVKRILPHLGDDATFREMFLNEGRIAAQLTHPNICQVHDLGEDADGLYLAMEFLEGVSWETFSQALPRDADGTFVRLIAGMLQQLAAGLGFAHELRDPTTSHATPVIHRDISPQNIFITHDGICKVLDFGVAKVLTERRRTRSGVIKGKLAYIAPEQLRGETVDVRADIFAVGIVLWELLTNQLLFDRNTDFMVWQAIQEAVIPAPSDVCAHVPAAVDAVVLRALNRDATLRQPSIHILAQEFCAAMATLGAPADALQLRAALQQCCPTQLRETAARVTAARRGRPRAAETLVPAPVPAPASATRPNTGEANFVARNAAARDSHASTSVPPRRRPVILAAVTLVTVATVASGIGIWWQQAQKPTSTTSPPSPASTMPAAAPLDDASVPRSLPATADAPIEARRRDDAVPATPAVPAPTTAAPALPSQVGTGFLSIDSIPFANIYADGKLLGETPLFRVALRAGPHSIRAVLADHRSKTFTIKIRKNETLAHGTLAW